MTAVRRTAVIIAAAGSSRRMGGPLPKQYMICDDAPVLVKAIRAFCDFEEIRDIVLVCDDAERCRQVLAPYGLLDRVTVVTGGRERQDSIAAGLAAVPADAGYVLVHDAARPFVSKDVIRGVLDCLERADGAVPCVRPKSTVRTKERTLDRSALYEVQTPQGFRAGLLRDAYAFAASDGFSGTDDAGVVEHYVQACGLNAEIAIAEGDYANIKITTPEDLPAMEDIRTGTGYDVHRLAAGRPLMLACVRVPFEMGLLGHSDADVVSHAIADAILGAAALGDIGKLFPDSDPAFEGMPGSVLLEKTAEILRGAGFTLINVDATLIAERPKVAPYTAQMRENCAKALGISPERISIKATTQEGLGITAQGGMAAMASATVRRTAGQI
jgi:2-C-methyl-D-erythritol 4-phosphate cytidylyltransferase/2-C-methyl-D-erythritol 2,4-cyclodiphosphate synthase